MAASPEKAASPESVLPSAQTGATACAPVSWTAGQARLALLALEPGYARVGLENDGVARPAVGQQRTGPSGHGLNYKTVHKHLQSGREGALRRTPPAFTSRRTRRQGRGNLRPRQLRAAPP
eukprot:scaffold390_cov115-Isochrysis_galbana.AAC.5